jgi:hypothetical protein
MTKSIVTKTPVQGGSFYSITSSPLKNIIPKADVIQSAYAGIAKGAGVVFVQQVGGAEFNETFNLW